MPVDHSSSANSQQSIATTTATLTPADREIPDLQLQQFRFDRNSPAALPVVRTHYRSYPITGTSATQLRTQMTKRGPIDPLEGRRYDAITHWAVRWSYRYNRAGNQCAIGSFTTRVDVTFTYPDWKPPVGTAQTLLTEWQRYFTALQLHEDGHKNTGIAAGQEVTHLLSQFPAYPSCQKLDAAVGFATKKSIQRHNQKDVDYDHRTRHGYTQGAVFPAVATVLR